MLETNMSNKLKLVFPEIMIQNIETSTGLGIPDIAYGHEEVNGWIELKSIDDRVPVHKVTIPWEPGQLGWYHRYRNMYKCKQPYFLVLTIKDKWYFIHDMILEKYSMTDLNIFYICTTKTMQKHKSEIKTLLMRR